MRLHGRPSGCEEEKKKPQLEMAMDEDIFLYVVGGRMVMVKGVIVFVLIV